MRFLQYSLYLTEIAIFYDRVVRPASDLAHPSILKDSFTIARRDPSRKTAACLLRPQHPHRGARSDRGAPRARRRSHRAGRAHRRDGSLPRTPRSRRALLPRPHSPHGGHVRPPGARLHLFIYGFWNCLNVVTAAPGVPHAVLLRAIEPLEGVTDRTSGPGLLCRAMHIDRRLNGIDLAGDVLWLEPAPAGAPPARVGRRPRLGGDYAGEWARRPWRFFDRASACVSRDRRHDSR